MLPCMTLRHTPYDGSRQPFSIGLAPLDPADWIEVDSDLARDLAEKQRLFAASPAAVFREEVGTRAAQAEARDLLVKHLLQRFPEIYRQDDREMFIEPAGTHVSFDTDEAPLWTASRLVQEDLCLMRRGESAWRLAAASVCFPSKWSLADKIGRELDTIHAPVPGLQGRMGDTIHRLFDRLPVDRPVWRLNWSIYGDDQLSHPETQDDPARPLPDRFFLRIERQTLRRLPISRDILFTIRIHLDPLETLAQHPRKADLIFGLQRQMQELTAVQAAYKGLLRVRDVILAELVRMA